MIKSQLNSNHIDTREFNSRQQQNNIDDKILSKVSTYHATQVQASI